MDQNTLARWFNLDFFIERSRHITKIMASGPITSWQIERETMETVTDFIFLHSKITAKDDCRQMSGQVSRGSAGEYQADERAGVGRLTYRVSGR